MSQIVKRITNALPSWRDGETCDNGNFGTAWPLSENLFLCNWGLAILLINTSTGAQNVVYVAPDGRPLDPMPLRPRATPPALATGTRQGERAGAADHKRATISIMNVYNGDMPLPTGTVIKSMRIMQVIPKATVLINNPPTGYASEGLCRMSLGTVQVDPDGSVYCEAPVGKAIYFQLLDEKGMAVQSMRADTYVHPGEQLTCYGCHEDKWTATPPANPTATRRAPSPLQPEPGAEPNGVTPINFARLVKPVFTSRCQPCHVQQAKGPTTMTSYNALSAYAFWFCSPGTGPESYISNDLPVPRYGGSRTLPGSFGAAYSRMGKALLDSTHQSAGITADEFRRVTLRLDGNSMELSAYTKVAEQRAGQLVRPELDYSQSSPTGVEQDHPLPGEARAFHAAYGRPFRTAGTPIVVRGGMLYLQKPEAGAVRVEVYDAGGRRIIARQLDPSQAAIRLPAAAGLYVIAVQGQRQHCAKKFTVMLQ